MTFKYSGKYRYVEVGGRIVKLERDMTITTEDKELIEALREGKDFVELKNEVKNETPKK